MKMLGWGKLWDKLLSLQQKEAKLGGNTFSHHEKITHKREQAIVEMFVFSTYVST